MPRANLLAPLHPMHRCGSTDTDPVNVENSRSPPSLLATSGRDRDSFDYLRVVEQLLELKRATDFE